MIHANVAHAVETLKGVVGQSEEMKAIVAAAQNPEDLGRLWAHPTFREAHDRVMANVSPADLASLSGELSEDELDVVAGGVTMDPRAAYMSLAFKSFKGVVAPIDAGRIVGPADVR